MADFDQLLDDLEAGLADVDALDSAIRDRVLALLDGMDVLHRHALQRLAVLLGPGELARVRARDPAGAGLLDAYAVGIDERAAADAALDRIRPYIASHGGRLELIAAGSGIVRVRLSGACSGCTASAVTLRAGVEEALRDHFPGFAAMEVEEDDALAHPPPGPTLLQIQNHIAQPAGGTGAA